MRAPISVIKTALVSQHRILLHTCAISYYRRGPGPISLQRNRAMTGEPWCCTMRHLPFCSSNTFVAIILEGRHGTKAQGRQNVTVHSRRWLPTLVGAFCVPRVLCYHPRAVSAVSSGGLQARSDSPRRSLDAFRNTTGPATCTGCGRRLAGSGGVQPPAVTAAHRAVGCGGGAVATAAHEPPRCVPRHPALPPPRWRDRIDHALARRLLFNKITPMQSTAVPRTFRWSRLRR